MVRLSVIAIDVGFLVTGIAAQDLSQAPPALGASALQIGRFNGDASFSAESRQEGWRWQVGNAAGSGRIRLITFEQIKHDPTLADGVLDRLVHKSHRIEVRGDSMRKNRGQPRQVAGLI